MQSGRNKADLHHINKRLLHCRKQVVGRAISGDLSSSRVASGLAAVPNRAAIAA